ncbi:hypothetical protein LIER_18269 [Lithospermum erythrorhizon]|uniref:RNase H type-1 domain-containing protein n=1 Tax=Lithospermum erythrorhizon TaxID=34254 RepID=A0AAV3QDC6_LITER
MWIKPWVPRMSDYKLRGGRGNGPRWVSQLIKNGAWDREEGAFLGAKFIHFPNVSSSLMAEALAIRSALEYACLSQWRKVEIESDSKQLIQLLNGRQNIPTEVEIVIGDIFYLVDFLKVKFQFTSRVFNNVAHSIAHWDNGELKEAIWSFNPQSWLFTPRYTICT